MYLNFQRYYKYKLNDNVEKNRKKQVDTTLFYLPEFKAMSTDRDNEEVTQRKSKRHYIILKFVRDQIFKKDIIKRDK